VGIQLYLSGPTRQEMLREHDLYVAQMRRRIFPQFAEIEREADAEYQRLGNNRAMVTLIPQMRGTTRGRAHRSCSACSPT
jgi:hypothetical protein